VLEGGLRRGAGFHQRDSFFLNLTLAGFCISPTLTVIVVLNINIRWIHFSFQYIFDFKRFLPPVSISYLGPTTGGLQCV
jgi:hypothetical protein